MRRTWLNTITAALCAAGAAATTAEGSPADMMLAKREPAASTSAPPAIPRSVAAAQPDTGKVSPYKHPIKYLSAAVADLPLPGRSKANDIAAKPKVKQDVLSLATPTGKPTPQLKIATAQMCETKGDIAGARRQYQEALKTWPGDVDVLRAAARMEDRQGQMQVAESLYQQAVRSNPQHAGAHNDLGMCLARQGQLEASIQEIEQAVRMEPNSQRYRNNAAVVLVEMRQDQRALAHLSAVHPGADAHYNMGQLLVQRGRQVDAEPYFAAALELNPAMQPAYEALTRLQGAHGGHVPTVAVEPSMPAAAPVAAPATAPAMVVPQPASPSGPQMSFPETARNPAYNTSGYVAPGYYSGSQMPQQSTPRVGQAPRYLPAVPAAGQPQPAGAGRR